MATCRAAAGLQRSSPGPQASPNTTSDDLCVALPSTRRILRVTRVPGRGARVHPGRGQLLSRCQAADDEAITEKVERGAHSQWVRAGPDAYALLEESLVNRNPMISSSSGRPSGLHGAVPEHSVAAALCAMSLCAVTPVHDPGWSHLWACLDGLWPSVVCQARPSTGRTAHRRGTSQYWRPEYSAGKLAARCECWTAAVARARVVPATSNRLAYSCLVPA